MRVLLIVVAVLFFAVYGFKLYLPTASGTLEISSGFANGLER